MAANDSIDNRIVYVVSDDAAICDSIAALLTASRIRTHTYTSGDAFLRHYVPSAGGCLLLDGSLRAAEAARLLTDLRQLNSRLPVVLMTEDAELVDANLRSRADAPHLLLKPFSESTLLGCVQACHDAQAAA